MREAQLAARVRQRDLAVVHVAGEHEVEAAGLEAVEDAREVAEQDPEVGARATGRSGRPSAADDQARVDARDPHRPPAQLDELALVTQQRRRLELAQVRRARERVARDREVVVAEHRERRLRQPRRELRAAAARPADASAGRR